MIDQDIRQVRERLVAEMKKRALDDEVTERLLARFDSVAAEIHEALHVKALRK